MTKYYQAMIKPAADAGGNLTNVTYSGWGTEPFVFDPVTAGDYLVGYMVWDDTVRTVQNPKVMPTVQAVGAMASNNSSSISVVPPAHVAGDILVAVLSMRQSVTVPDLFGLYGWNIISAGGNGTSGTRQKLVIAWKRATGTNSEGNLTWAPATAQRAGFIMNIRGAHASLPPVLLGENWTNTASTAVSINGGTTTEEQNLVLQAFTTNQASGLGDIASAQTNASLSNLVNQVEFGSGGSIQGIYATTGGKAVAGTVDPLTATLSTAYSYGGASIAFLAA